ncbi:MAG: SusC/RagA family TonB-linked outer membrane protein [Prolixibacteraceae bacterium]|nr:SusC/RagA family TonB-linked outer membrane protein [Prolixibacteraceae bacterium]
MKNIKINRLLIFCTLICLFSNNKLIAQDGEISTVTMQSIIIDDMGNPMSDIVVKAFNSKDIAVTRKDGSFDIKVSSGKDEILSILKSGYEHKIVNVVGGKSPSEKIVINKEVLFNGKNLVSLPYKETTSNRNVSSIYTISGEELESCPSPSLLQALAGLIPGLTIHQYSSSPGDEMVYAFIRNEEATTYVDGVARDVADLSVFEVESVQVLKDLSSRAALGIMGSNPIIWIETKQGKSYNREVGISAEYGMSMPTSVPNYVDAFDYATLYNQASVNDGMKPYYSEEALKAYKNNSDPVNYPNVDYLSRYVNPSAPFMRANIDFSGGDKKVNYYTLFNYVGSRGLESMGEVQKSDRFKLRANVNIKLNDFISMNVNLSGTYKTGRFLRGDSYLYQNGRLSIMKYNIFQQIAQTPANAHPISVGDKLIISDDYPTNIENELLYSGYTESSQLFTQNNASLKVDLNEWVKGLSFNAMMCLDASGKIVVGKGGTANLYRIVQTSSGADSTELITPSVVESDLAERGSDIARKTVAQLSLNYENNFGKHSIFANATYFQGLFEYKGIGDYQPEKMQDLALRFNYSYDNKYIVQIDPVISGSMRLPKGKRFSLYPTIGLSWIASNESFLKDLKAINFLKVNASFGIMGTNSFTLGSYNSFYLHKTLWSRQGSLMMGIPGKYSTVQTAYGIMQQGSDDYSLPKKRYFNIGLQSSMFDNSLAFEVGYFINDLYDIISQKESYTPSIFGGGQFLPATNFGEILYYGVDGMIQYTKEIGDFKFITGANILYGTGKVIEWDEPLALEDYRKRAGKYTDEYVLYDSEGLFQSQEEINSRETAQNFGELKPGDIKYVDYNNDGTIDEKDQYRTGAHSARIQYGLNLSLGYKGFELKVIGQGRADGQQYIGGTVNTFNGVEYVNNSYFTSSGYRQNFSDAMLEAWPASNNYPRLSITSVNNLQESTFWLRDASYFRIKNIELAYNFPNRLTKSTLMSDCRIYVRGSNLFETHALSEYGLDPENSNFSFYPIYKTFSIGVSCKF